MERGKLRRETVICGRDLKTVIILLIQEHKLSTQTHNCKESLYLVPRCGFGSLTYDSDFSAGV